MILQSLISLYDRLYAEGKVLHYGFMEKDIGFVINIDKNGNMLGPPEELRNKIVFKKFSRYEYKKSFVPYSTKINSRSRNGASTANFLVDGPAYVFGVRGNNLSPTHTHLASFKNRIEEVCGNTTDEALVALRKFYDTWNPENMIAFENAKKMVDTHSKLVAFRLEGDNCFIHERPASMELWLEYLDKEVYSTGTNLIDGTTCDIQSTYSQLNIGTGVSLVSFNEKAYESYGKTKNENAQISVMDDFKIGVALNYLVNSRNNRVNIGDTKIVFWASRASKIESIFGILIDPYIAEKDVEKELQNTLINMRLGKMPQKIEKEEQTDFFIFGFSTSGKGRISTRFWHKSTVADMYNKLQDHFSNLCIEDPFEVPVSYGISNLVQETARKSDGVPPILPGALLVSIITGVAYPYRLYTGTLARIRVESHSDKYNIKHLKASILKATLIRNFNKEVTVSLDNTNKDTPYLLGRLFALLEKTQSDALGQTNTTVKSRFFGSASATPAAVFPRLIKLVQHHVKKSEYGDYMDHKIEEVMRNLNEFPTNLTLQDQGVFMIGYYHQRNDLYKKKGDNCDAQK